MIADDDHPSSVAGSSFDVSTFSRSPMRGCGKSTEPGFFDMLAE